MSYMSSKLNSLNKSNSERRNKHLRSDKYLQDEKKEIKENKENEKSLSMSSIRSGTSKLKQEKSVIYFGLSHSKIQEKLPNNTISTTKYSAITFFPKSLLFQFKRAANIYFLLVSILTCLDFSPKKPSSMIGTFAFVLIATMIKELIEDYSRYKQDKLQNSREVERLSSSGWERVKCENLHPGEIVKINKEDEFSADCLIINSNNENGYCYIDTKNLDGETNLKEKMAIEQLQGISDYKKFSGLIKCDKSNENLHSFEGVISSKEDVNEESRVSSIFVNLKNLILKGCTLKNCEYVIGIVIYTGINTKIMRNSKQPKLKMSKILRKMNLLLYSLFIFTIVICFVLAYLSLDFKNSSSNQREYIFNSNKQSESDISYYFIRVIIFFVAYSNIIPISLYVALEIVKIVQGVFIFYDNQIFDYESDRPSKCRATDLIEELGQVEFVFSDKTGTLTQNNMILKKCFCANQLYGNRINQNINMSEGGGNNLNRVNSMNPNPNPNTNKEDMKFSINGDKEIYNHLKEESSLLTVKQKEQLNDFILAMSLCHSVFPEPSDKGILYQGASPDDIALVSGAARIGYVFTSKDYNILNIVNEINNENMYYESLVEMPFDSDRKRMTVIVKEKKTDKYILYSKGADTTMNDRINWNLCDSVEIENYKNYMDILCKEGLRCLVFGKKEIDVTTFENWFSKYQTAISKGRDVSKYYNELEVSFDFLGLTAIEDKLQEGVDTTIKSLMNCGIRVWVLTGDKQDTAIEIAKSCKLINEKTQLVKFVEFENVETQILTMIHEVGLDCSEILGEDFIYKFKVEQMEEMDKSAYYKKLKRNIDLNLAKTKLYQSNNNKYETSIVIDGLCLDVILSSFYLSTAFFYLASACNSVICCRVSPKQKSKVVKLAKIHGDWITLSIGDGANDVPMIMEAHIGVGIQGKEGSQAARNGDFSIGQFRFLEKLLLDYGRNSYVKISKFICFYFYKNILLALTEFYFAIYSGFSGGIYFADYLNTMYNAFFTSWPCLFFFSFEREHSLELVRMFPSLYFAGQINYYFNLKVFWSYIFYSILHSALCFYIPFIDLQGVIDSNGFTYNQWYISTVSFSLVIHVGTLKLLLLSRFWNKVSLLSLIASIIFYWVCLFVLSNNFLSIKFQPEIIGIPYNIVAHPKTILILIVASVLIISPDIIIKQITENYYGNPSIYLSYLRKKKYDLIKISEFKRVTTSFMLKEEDDSKAVLKIRKENKDKNSLSHNVNSINNENSWKDDKEDKDYIKEDVKEDVLKMKVNEEDYKKDKSFSNVSSNNNSFNININKDKDKDKDKEKSKKNESINEGSLLPLNRSILLEENPFSLEKK